MDYTTFSRVETTLTQAQSLLAQDEDLRKLLIMENPLVDSAPGIEQTKQHIFLQPVVEIEVKPPFDKKCFLSLVISESKIDEEEVSHGLILRINVLVDKTYWVYNSTNIRILKIIERVVAVLDKKKLACSSALFYDGAVETVTNSYIFGYVVYFKFIDGIGVSDDNQ